MEYALIFILQVLGVCFHVMQKVISIGDKYPVETPKSIFKIFWKEDWDTLAVSGLVLILSIITHYIIFDKLDMVMKPEWFYQIIPYVVSLVLGYAGQRLVYKWFGSAEKFLDKQVTDKFQ